MIDVIEDSSINAFLFLMPIKLGTPPVMNLVAIDTGSTLSWVQCQPCEPHCHDQAAEAGQIFDPTKSTTFRHARCISRECFSIKHELIRLQSANCMEEEDTCLYTMSFGGDTTGKVDIGFSFLFGCSLDVEYSDKEAGAIGFGSSSFSFFEQVAKLINYKAFTYCLPSDETVKKGI
ncbi:hypothetical protein C2845_PM06G03980 [Panicum miliaceum]|uniref:Peptidase A1 domain-containing protein n=1 Tax=Panicum miliaceum TaxID=4540 RepID=A0A3L6R4U4_PANMI|nr:hypothetical protein C2845_PM06G03980 [Panicum miliaceum]